MINHHAFRCLIITVSIVLVASQCLASVTAEISYQLTNLGEDRWQYEYQVANTGTTTAIEEFTIWFDESLYENLAVVTQPPIADSWSEIASQPDPWIPLDGFYDALASVGGILPGSSEGSFAVSFDWLGDGIPSDQPFEVIDPVSFDTLSSGTTFPEPATLILLALGSFVVLRREGSTGK